MASQHGQSPTESTLVEEQVEVESSSSQQSQIIESASRDHPNTPTPLPRFQLFLVYLIQFAEPITATVIYPFVNQFVRDTGITGGDERKTGYYAGIVGSVFFLAEALTVFHWAQMSDRVGRRPVLLLGPIGLAVTMLCFGLSTSFWALVVSRSLQGVFNGVIGVSKTIIAELTDSTNIADAYALMPAVWSIGLTVGPSVGGLLAEPAKQWPSLFGKNTFFINHPYFLPCATAGALAAMTAILGFFGLHETLPSALRKQNRVHQKPSGYPDQESTPLLGDDNNNPTYNTVRDATTTGERSAERQTQTVESPQELAPSDSFWDLLTPQVLITLLVYTFQSFSTMATQVLQPLVYSTSIPLGGLGMDAYEIGIILTAFGFVNAIFQLAFMGRLMRWYGARSLQISNHAFSVLHVALYPLLIVEVKRAGNVDGIAWAIILVQHFCRLTNGLGWGSIQVLVVNSAPSRASLGATNGLAQAVGCATRAVAPAVAASLFSFSIEKQYLGGNLVYFLLSVLAALGVWTSFWLPRP